ncbi:hypothetical protein HOY82DRAFT_576890 [Tuber indicum]|nr:hypothetical protein HOY82DRAFT_576890 [Tuber indicum]
MPLDRSAVRNNFVSSSNDPDIKLGDIYASPGITNHNFHAMSGELVERDDEQLQPGNHYIATNGSVTLTEEAPPPRTTSMLSGTRTKSFREAVRHRDGGCIFTGRHGIPGRWTSLPAVHIFPLAYERLWNRFGYGNFISMPPDRESDGSINSVQNGICLCRDMQCFFDNYIVAINPNDEYKFVTFGHELARYNPATHVNPRFHQNIAWPPDKLLLWHYHQAVLTNMRMCAGESFVRLISRLAGI